MTMTGNKFELKLAFGLLLWGLVLGLSNVANAQTTEKDINKAMAKDVVVRGVIVGDKSMISNKATEAGAREITMEERIQQMDRANELRNTENAQDARANLRALEREAGGGSRVWGAMTNWMKSDEKLEERARSLNKEVGGSAAGNAAAEGFRDRSLSNTAKAAASRVDTKVYTTQDLNGNEVNIFVNNDLTAQAGIFKGCIPILVKLDQTRRCLFCPLFKVLFSTAQSMSYASYDRLAAGFSNLLLIGFALYLAFVSLKQVSAFTKQDGPKFITETLTQSFKVLLAFLLLRNVQELYDLVLSPMLTAGIEFGAEFLFRAKGAVSEDNPSGNFFQMCLAASQLDGIAKGFYDNSLFAKIDCFVRAVQQEIAVAQSMGSSFMCVARNAGSHWYGMWDLTMMITGLIIWIFSWLICLAFAFYLIDSVVKLGIVGALLPFLIAAWPFKITSGYTTKGWQMFLNTFFTFVFLGMVVSINIELSFQAATGGEGGSDKLNELFNRDSIAELLEVMSIGFTGLLFLLLCCIFGFKLCAEAIALAQQMSGGQSGSIGSKIGSLGAAAAKGVGKKAGKTAWKGVKGGAKAGMVATGADKKLDDVRNNIKNSLRSLGNRYGVAGGSSSGSGDTGGGGGTPTSSGTTPQSRGTTQQTNTQTTGTGGGTPGNEQQAAQTGNSTTPTGSGTPASGTGAMPGQRGTTPGTGGQQQGGEGTGTGSGANPTGTQQFNPQGQPQPNGEATEAGPRPETSGSSPTETKPDGQGTGQSSSDSKPIDKNQAFSDDAARAKAEEVASKATAKKGGDTDKKTEEAKKAAEQAKGKTKELENKIRELQAEINSQKDSIERLKNNASANFPGVQASEAEAIRKLEEEKKTLERQLAEERSKL